MYYYVDKEKEAVTILGFYPKTGKFGKSDLTKQEEKNIIQEYKTESRIGTLIEHNVVESFSYEEY